MANQNGKIAHFGSLCDAVTNRHPQGGESAPFDADAMKSGNVLGKKIAEARKQKKISQKDLSQLFSGYMSALEPSVNGKKGMPFLTHTSSWLFVRFSASMTP